MLKFEFYKLKLHLTALFSMAIIAFMGVFLISHIARTASSTEADPSDQVIINLNKQIDEQRAKIDKLVGKINEYNQSIKNTRGEAATLNNQMLIIDNNIAKTDIDIEAKEEEAKAVQLEIQKTELEIKNNELEIGKSKEKLSEFIRLLNNYDDKNYLYVLLANDSFSEFFDQVKYSEGIQEDLQKTLNKVQEATEKLNRQKSELAKKQEQLSALLKKLDDEKANLDDQKNTKQYLITQTKKSERNFQNMVSDLKKEQSAANAQIAALEAKVRAELKKKGGNEKFNTLGNAVLAWPTASHRITATFHDPDYPYRNLFEHSGLDLGIGKGTPVKAAEAGYVAKVALGTQWYGNYIMIIHNNNLATLYAHLNSVNVKTDDYVSKGQLIGLSGSTGFSSGPHLHFEVRHNGIPTDPMSYLP